ncbi:MAG TPA: FapA family protein [Bacillota bacterium]|nr:FapA family protein [Bacillota bacterium]
MSEAGPQQLNGWLKLDISRDDMEVYLSVVPPTLKEGTWPDLEHAKQLLRQEVITYGLMDEKVEQVVNQRISTPVLIAKGTSPVQGENAVIEFLFPTERREAVPKEGEDGRVDFREVSVIHNVHQGDVLAVKKPATKGIDGRDVHAREVQAKPGKDKTLALGRNVAWSEDGLQLIATADGEPTLFGNRVSVLSVHEVSGVNFKSGNVDFLGNVVIKGNVESGFTVKAEGDVTVAGSIEAAMIYCGGSLTVMGGIIGQDKTEIRCGGNLTAYYIERASIEAGGDIKVRDAVMHSKVSAAGNILLYGRKGLLVGGLCRAGEQIELQVLGSRLGTATEIEVGVNPGLRTELIEVEEKIKSILDNLDKSNKILVILERDARAATPERAEMREKLSKTVAALTQERYLLEKRRQELVEEIQVRFQDRGRVKARDTIYPGVRVTIGKAIMAIKDEVRFATLTYSGGEIVIQSYR